MSCKKIPLFICSAAMLAYAVCAAAAPQAPADDLKIGKTTRPVVFKHSVHVSGNGIACAQCHHPVAGKENFASCSTAGCHDLVGDREDSSARGYFYHLHSIETSRPTCSGCHMEVAEKNPAKEDALTGCSESKCHP